MKNESDYDARPWDLGPWDLGPWDQKNYSLFPKYIILRMFVYLREKIENEEGL